MVSARCARVEFPHLIVAYLEDKLDCPSFQYPSNLKIMTRAAKKIFERQNISVDVNATIVRNIGFEKAVLKIPAGKIVERRNTTAAGKVDDHPTSKTVKKVPIGFENTVLKTQAGKIVERRNTTAAGKVTDRPTLKAVKKVPFGARGRKRRTLNVLFIGIKPNPDGRKLVHQVNFVACTAGETTPRGRTYARAMSTPLPKTIDFTPPSTEPANDLNISPIDAESTTYDADSFDFSSMGNLHYSSSE